MKYIGILAVVFLVGCAAELPYQKAKINGMYKILGAQIYSPNERGWYVLQHSQDSIVFGMAPSGSDSTVAGVNLFWIGEFDTDRDFLEHIIAERVKNEDPQRWVNRVIENTFLTINGNSCFSYKSLTEDHQSKSKSKKSFQYYHTIGNICRHPANKSAAVQVEVSYRADLKEMPVSIEGTANQFMNSLELLNNEVK